VNRIPLATVKLRIQPAENSTPAEVINTEAAYLENAIFLGYLISKVALEERNIGSTDQKIPIANNCTDGD